MAEAAQGIDQSYSLSGITLTLTIDGIPFTSTIPSSSFQETAADAIFTDCTRTTTPTGQAASTDDHRNANVGMCRAS